MSHPASPIGLYLVMMTGLVILAIKERKKRNS